MTENQALIHYAGLAMQSLIVMDTQLFRNKVYLNQVSKDHKVDITQISPLSEKDVAEWAHDYAKAMVEVDKKLGLLDE